MHGLYLVFDDVFVWQVEVQQNSVYARSLVQKLRLHEVLVLYSQDGFVVRLGVGEQLVVFGEHAIYTSLDGLGDDRGELVSTDRHGLFFDEVEQLLDVLVESGVMLSWGVVLGKLFESLCDHIGFVEDPSVGHFCRVGGLGDLGNFGRGHVEHDGLAYSVLLLLHEKPLSETSRLNAVALKDVIWLDMDGNFRGNFRFYRDVPRVLFIPA